MKMSTRYIEIVRGVGAGRLYLVDAHLREIGELTRENVAYWLDNIPGPDAEGYPIMDFHVVCDDIDIPWATKEGRDCYQRIMEKCNSKSQIRG